MKHACISNYKRISSGVVWIFIGVRGQKKAMAIHQFVGIIPVHVIY
jgi:hypothetical protein